MATRAVLPSLTCLYNVLLLTCCTCSEEYLLMLLRLPGKKHAILFFGFHHLRDLPHEQLEAQRHSYPIWGSRCSVQYPSKSWHWARRSQKQSTALSLPESKVWACTRIEPGTSAAWKTSQWMLTWELGQFASSSSSTRSFLLTMQILRRPQVLKNKLNCTNHFIGFIPLQPLDLIDVTPLACIGGLCWWKFSPLLYSNWTLSCLTNETSFMIICSISSFVLKTPHRISFVTWVLCFWMPNGWNKFCDYLLCVQCCSWKLLQKQFCCTSSYLQCVSLSHRRCSCMVLQSPLKCCWTVRAACTSNPPALAQLQRGRTQSRTSRASLSGLSARLFVYWHRF